MTGESDEMLKASLEHCLNEHKNKSPFLISGTKVNEGTGVMLVLRGTLIF
jgi:Ca2+-transporting ATPase/Ca2+ transporting ATPase